MTNERRDDFEEAWAAFKRELGAIPLWPLSFGDYVAGTWIVIVGTIAAVQSNMGLWTMPYTVLLVVIGLALRTVLILWARGKR